MSGEKCDDAAGDHSLRSEVLRASEAEGIPVPFEQSYWVIGGRFLAGAYPGDRLRRAAEKKLRNFLQAGIRCFVDLTSPEEKNMFGRPLAPYEDLLIEIAEGHFRTIYRRMPIPYLQVPTHAEMEEILDFIDGSIISDLPVYVHCLGGIGRTGTVVGCWLVRHGIAQGETAMEMIRRLRRGETSAAVPCPETAAQREFIGAWKKGE